MLLEIPSNLYATPNHFSHPNLQKNASHKLDLYKIFRSTKTLPKHKIYHTKKLLHEIAMPNDETDAPFPNK